MNADTGTVTGLRVAHLIESDGPGGAERVLGDLAASLQAGGATNVAFLPARGEGWIGRQLDGSGVAVEHFHIDRPVSPACVRGLAAAFRRHRVTVAHSHEFSMAVYGAWAARLVGIPHVITMHGGRYYAGRLRRRLALRGAIALSGRTTAVSTSVARALGRDLRISPARTLVIPNGVRYEPPARLTLRDELHLGADAKLLVAVGSLYPVKGHRYLIDALELLALRHPTVHVVIAGRGELDQALRARACEHRLSHRVHLLGLRSDVGALVASADLFVMPSLSEGLPLALLEAMFAGRAIVASDVGDVGVALARGDAGVLVPAANALALADAIARLLGDPSLALALGERAAVRAAAEYGVSRMVDQYVGVYRHLLARRRPLAIGARAPAVLSRVRS